jgi:hypothetical protein
MGHFGICSTLTPSASARPSVIWQLPSPVSQYLTGVAYIAEHRRCTKAVWLRHGGGLDADVACAIIGNGIGKLVWTKKS